MEGNRFTANIIENIKYVTNMAMPENKLARNINFFSSVNFRIQTEYNIVFVMEILMTHIANKAMQNKTILNFSINFPPGIYE